MQISDVYCKMLLPSYGFTRKPFSVSSQRNVSVTLIHLLSNIREMYKYFIVLRKKSDSCIMLFCDVKNYKRQLLLLLFFALAKCFELCAIITNWIEVFHAKWCVFGGRAFDNRSVPLNLLVRDGADSVSKSFPSATLSGFQPFTGECSAWRKSAEGGGWRNPVMHCSGREDFARIYSSAPANFITLFFLRYHYIIQVIYFSFSMFPDYSRYQLGFVGNYSFRESSQIKYA